MQTMQKNMQTRTINVLDHGYVKLVGMTIDFPEEGEEISLNGDSQISEAARVSYAGGTKKVRGDDKLIDYLIRMRHDSPLEMPHFKFQVKAPLFVMQQLLRHRTSCLAGDTRLWFDQPSGVAKGRRKRSNMTIKEFHDKWHGGAKPVPAKPRKTVDYSRIEADRLYRPKELAALTEYSSNVIRHMVNAGGLLATKQAQAVLIKGKDFIDYHRREVGATIIPLRDRLASMNLRSVNEQTGEIIPTNVTDIWETGVKPTYRVTLANGYAVEMTKDHRILTDKGWFTLEDAIGMKQTQGRPEAFTWRSGTLVAANGTPAHHDPNWLKQQKEAGLGVQEMADKAGVSYATIRKNLAAQGLQFTSQERGVLSGKSQKGTRRTLSPETREKMRENGRRQGAKRKGANNHWWKGGVSSIRQRIGEWTVRQAPAVHQRHGYACAICASSEGLEAHHVDPVWNNSHRAKDPDNLMSLCRQCHGNIHYRNLEMEFLAAVEGGAELSDFWNEYGGVQNVRPRKKRRPPGPLLVRTWQEIVEVEYAGEQMTYDLSVSGPYHNFIANGMTVHNSVNQQSHRYSVVEEEFYFPYGAWRGQSTTNKQMSDGLVDEQEFADKMYADAMEASFNAYEALLEIGVSREMARTVLPSSIYTTAVWQQDLRNLLHMIGLRTASDAQPEIQEYAKAMLELVEPHAPQAVASWRKHRATG